MSKSLIENQVFFGFDLNLGVGLSLPNLEDLINEIIIGTGIPSELLKATSVGSEYSGVGILTQMLFSPMGKINSRSAQESNLG